MPMYLGLAYFILQCIGIFPSSGPSTWSRWAFEVYRTFVFAITASITLLMTIQMCVVTDLTTLARTIDIWTMFLSGVYKWFCMSAFNVHFAELSTSLDRIQAQGKVAFGGLADQFTTNYLKLMNKIIMWYIWFGIIAVFFIVISPLITYSQG